MPQLVEYIKDQIWLLEYPVRFAAMDLFGRTSLIKLDNGDLIVHDPCKIDESIKREIDSIGVVKYIIAPGSYHHLFVTDFQNQYPKAETFLCPGLERKRPDIKFNYILKDEPDQRWGGVLDLVFVHGSKYIWEVAFFHKPSKLSYL